MWSSEAKLFTLDRENPFFQLVMCSYFLSRSTCPNRICVSLIMIPTDLTCRFGCVPVTENITRATTLQPDDATASLHPLPSPSSWAYLHWNYRRLTFSPRLLPVGLDQQERPQRTPTSGIRVRTRNNLVPERTRLLCLSLVLKTLESLTSHELPLRSCPE